MNAATLKNMPTGYTAALVEKGQTFPEFALTCARALGVLIDMRDEPLSAPIPEKFEPSSYHVDALERSKREVAGLEAMDDEAKVAFGSLAKGEELVRLQKQLEKDRLEEQRLSDMEAEVRAWTPPTSEHNGLKEFMLEQISTSRGWGGSASARTLESIDFCKEKSPVFFWTDAYSSAKWSVDYHEKEVAKEKQRAGDCTEWVRQLRESLAAAEAAICSNTGYPSKKEGA